MSVAVICLDTTKSVQIPHTVTPSLKDYVPVNPKLGFYSNLDFYFLDFFANYVDKSIPLLIRGGAKSSPAFKLWQDDYLKSHKEAETFKVFVENRKKEIRTEGGNNIPLKEFIETYHDKDVYMVNGVPDHLQYVKLY